MCVYKYNTVHMCTCTHICMYQETSTYIKHINIYVYAYMYRFLHMCVDIYNQQEKLGNNRKIEKNQKQY